MTISKTTPSEPTGQSLTDRLLDDIEIIYLTLVTTEMTERDFIEETETHWIVKKPE